MENEEVIITQEMGQVLTPQVTQLIKGEGYHLTKEVLTLKVGNETEYKRAIELGTANKRVLVQIESFRKAITKPLNDQIKNINQMFKKISERFDSNDTKVRDLITRYQYSRKKTESIQTVHTDTGRASISEVSAYEIIDESKVPREYLMLDITKIGRVVRGGAVTEILGLRIFKKKVTSFINN